MLHRVTAIEYIRDTIQGRTKPAILNCERADGSLVELVAKFSAGCDQKEINLAFEVLASCLAADLGLPVSEPFLVDLDPQWVATIPDASRRQHLERSSPVAFGSKLVTGYSAWGSGSSIAENLVPMAASIFVFDAIVQNVDRREGNPNCLVSGDKLRIFDHELCFDASIIIGWRPPWVLGGLKPLETPGAHIFRKGLRGRSPDFGHIRTAWLNITDRRLQMYEAAIPLEWSNASSKINAGISLIKSARDNIDACLSEIQRVLR